jgi:hypothetical protein
MGIHNAQASSTVVNVSHTWSGGEQSFPAIRTEITIDPMWEIDGRRVAKAYMLVMDSAAVDSYVPQVGEILRVAYGDEAAEELVVRQSKGDGLGPRGACVRLICAKEWSE